MTGGAPKKDLARDDTIQSDPARTSHPPLPVRFQSGARVTEREFIRSGDVPVINASGTSASEGLPVALGDVIAGKYQVERVLGRGGAGIVVLARNLDLDEPVALKFLRPEVAELPEVVARFAREAKSAVSIKSEHVCKVLDVGTLPSGAPYMVMEYLEGRDLYRVMHERGALPVAEGVEYVLQACEALALAHARGIVHRDVKPENIFLIEPPEGLPYIKVLDFGISKAALIAGVNHDSIIKTGSLLGTPAYMSPEQIRATSSVDARTDIWALGIVLYEILTARAAFTADSVPQMAAAILEQEPASIRKIRVDIPVELAAIIGLCMSKDRNKRPADVAALASMLLPFAPKRARISVERAESVLHRTSSSGGEHAPPSSRSRSRAPLAIAALFIVAVLVVTVVALTRKPAPIEVVVPPPPTVTVTVAGPTPPAVTVTITTTVTAPPVVASATTVTAPAITKATVKPPAKPSASTKSTVDLGF